MMKHFILCFQCLSRSTAVEIVNSSKVLQAETRMLLDGKLLVQFHPWLLSVVAYSLRCLCSSLSRLDVSHFSFCFLIIVFVWFLLTTAPCTLLENVPLFTFVQKSKYNKKTRAKHDIYSALLNVYPYSPSLFCSYLLLPALLFYLPRFWNVYKPFQT